MDGQERIIRRLFTDQRCHHCGRPYEADRLLVLARRSEVWMVMISCLDCEQKDTYVVKFPPQMQGRRRVTSYRLSKPPVSTPFPQKLEETDKTPSKEPETPISSQPVSTDDVLDMRLFLKNFNGNFQKLFTETE